jgi:XRE family aerobic/anaerobic benzoate catabolism transcriptional regulator
MPGVKSREMPYSARALAGPVVRAVLEGPPLSHSESHFLSELGDRLRAMRLCHHLSRRELARRSRISERYIARIEAGKGNVSIVLLLRLARALRSAEVADADAKTTTGERHWENLFSPPRSATLPR